MAWFKKSESHPEPDEPDVNGLATISQTIEDLDMPGYVRDMARKELKRLQKTDPSVAEFSIGMNYLELILDLPWRKSSPDNMDIEYAEAMLNREHLGLYHIKERILEYLASNIIYVSKSFQVLVVDDEDITRENIGHVLNKEGYLVFTARDGQEAIELLAENDIDLIITDMKMEKVDGLQLLEHVKHTAPEIEIILITGYATVNTAVEALRGGATHYLTKPLNLDVLKRTVSEVKSRHQRGHMAGPILCFTGPPGTGKTSIGRGVAQAMGRKFIRLSMAGLKDEAELRGHRRTYTGAMPGRIINEIRRIGVNNPVIMLDEVDKIGQDFRGDPASVLLEVLDPEQNCTFLDYYLDISFDLSNVLFITTANLADTLPRPLLDRMETLFFPSYSLEEKKRIGLSHLVPKQTVQHGQDHSQIHFSEAGLETIIRDYTREAGLRNLEREIGSLCRKINRLFLKKEIAPPVEVDEQLVRRLLGPARFMSETAHTVNLPGVTTGLVWTEFGGQLIFIETARMRGSGKLILTGSLGDVLRESGQTALSFVRSHAHQFEIDETLFEKSDIHVHIPAGNIPKDGPSAGLTIAVALISLLTNRPAKRDVAMSGELSLSGRLLPVSGLREKILAAQQAGVRLAIFPKQNEISTDTLEDDVRQDVALYFVETIKSAVDMVLE
ncbi:MAG: S16 family serine protease [Desulfovermiculus sp.]